MELRNTNDTEIVGNTLTGNAAITIWLSNSSYNMIARNNVSNNGGDVELDYSSHNCIIGNNIANNALGIDFCYSLYNNLLKNNITANGAYGVDLWEDEPNHSSSYNIIAGNNIANSPYGIEFDDSSYNSIYHNNFIDNAKQVYDDAWGNPEIVSSINVWDDGYPSGGNYWSDYTGVDLKTGQNQDQLGSDGIGDKPYVIDPNNIDHYPLMSHWTLPAPCPPAPPVGGEWVPIDKLQLLAPWISLISLMTLLVTSFVYIKRKRRQN